jgi:YidC/Oxa1 family membrane protein insertase
LDKKQLYVVMLVSVLLLGGIFIYRWATGESKGPEKPKTTQPNSQTVTEKSPETPREAPRRQGLDSRDATAVIGPATTATEAEPLDAAGVTNLKLLVRRFRIAMDQEKVSQAAIILRQAVTVAKGNDELLALADEALDVWWGKGSSVQALAPEVELAAKRVQVGPGQGGFERSYVTAAATIIAGSHAQAAQAWMRAEQAARADLQKGKVATWRCVFELKQNDQTVQAPSCAQAVTKGGDHRALLFGALLALRQQANSPEAAALLSRSLKLEPAQRAAVEALAGQQRASGSVKEASMTLCDGAAALAVQGRHKAALALFGAASELQPQEALPKIGMARSHEAQGDVSKALGALRMAATMAKGNIQVRLDLARLLRKEDLLGAIRVLEEAEQIDPVSQVIKRELAAARDELASRRPSKVSEKLTVIDGKRMRMIFTSAGGVPKAIVLKNPKYRERGDVKGPELRAIKEAKLDRQVNLVRTWSEWWLPLRLSFVKPSFPAPSWQAAQDWQRIRWDRKTQSYRTVEGEGEHQVKEGSRVLFGYRWPVEYEGMHPPPVVVERLYSIDPDNAYHFDMEIRVVSRSIQKHFVQLEIRVPSYDKLEEDRSFFNPISLKKEAVCMVGDKVKMQTLPTLFHGTGGCMGCDASTCACRRTPAKGEVAKEELVPGGSKDRSMSFTGKVHWLGVDEMYFLLGLAMSEKEDSTCTLSGWKDPVAPKNGVLVSRVVLPARELAHKDSVVSHKFTVYSGPKISEELERVRVAGSNPKLEESIDYGFFWFIGQPMIFVMKKIHVLVANWGIAIILLTLLIKLFTLPLTIKQMRSMKGMAKLKPEMDKLKEKYGDDKQRFQQEMMALYKSHKINPLGGCLPLLIQMPIYIAWYQALMVSVDLYNAPLFGWIHDLTKPDSVQLFGFGIPILPLLMGATMFLQQRMTPTTVDSAQQKMMMYMMPAMFTFFMLFLPSGLTLYILTNTLLSMAHQWYMNHAD